MRETDKTIEAMKQALETLEFINTPLRMNELFLVGRAINALRAAIAEESGQEDYCKVMEFVSEEKLIKAIEKNKVWEHNFCPDTLIGGNLRIKIKE